MSTHVPKYTDYTVRKFKKSFMVVPVVSASRRNSTGFAQKVISRGCLKLTQYYRVECTQARKSHFGYSCMKSYLIKSVF